MRVAVVGASGFVGAAVVTRLLEMGLDVVSVRCPRILSCQFDETLLKARELSIQLGDADVVVNCAGVSDAVGADEELLMQGNAYAAETVAIACKNARVGRLIHVSSAAVQGRSPLLDSTARTRAFSPYSRSKAEGEVRVRRQFENAVIYRPPGVHDSERNVTVSLVRFGASAVACVAGSGDYPSPQSLIGNVADAVGFMVIAEPGPPAIVAHPWEGITTSSLLRALGNKEPIRIPRPVARLIISLAFGGGRLFPSFAGHARRAEVLWFGQAQARSWLTSAGWTPPFGATAWNEMGADIREKFRVTRS